MKAMLKIERFGVQEANKLALFRRMLNKYSAGAGSKVIGSGFSNPWVAQIVGTDPQFRLSRRFLQPSTDYKESNSAGSRGIHFFYVLESGNLYEAKEQVSWKKWGRYFCAVTESGDIHYLTDDEVQEWLSAL